MSGSHLQDGHSICCHSNQLTTEEGDVELSIQVVSKNNISFYGINFVQYNKVVLDESFVAKVEEDEEAGSH